MAGTINVPLLSVFNDKGIRDAMKGLNGLSGSIKSLSKMALGAYSGMQLFAKSVEFVSNSANAARDLQRNMAGVSTIFGQNTAKMQEFIKTSESMGMSQAQAAQAVTFLGSVFKQTGMPIDKVMVQTKTMTSLAADLASTYGYSVSEALTAMTATFRGEYDPIEKFGVAMKQQQVNAELAAMGLGKLKGQALIAAQQQVRYNMILQRTSDAQGAFARQSNNLFEQQQILQAVWTDMQANLGQALIPALTALLGAISPLIQEVGPHLAAGFTALSDAIIGSLPSVADMTKGLTDFFDGISSALRILGPLAAKVIPDLVSNLPAIIGFFAIFKSAKFISGLTIAAIKFAEIAKATKLAEKAAEGAAVAETAAAAGATAVGAAAATATPKIAGMMMLMNANVITAIVGGLAAIAWGISNVMNQAYKARDAISKMNAELTSENITSSPNQVLAQGLKNLKVPANLQKAAQNALASVGKGATDETAKLLSKRTGFEKPSDTAATPTTTSTTTGTKKLTAAQKAAAAAAAAAKKTAAAIKAIVDETQAGLQKVADDLKATYDKMVTDAKAFTDNFSSVKDAFKALANVAPILGAFEQQTSDALQSLRDQAKDAFGKGLFGTGITADNALSELNKLVAGQEQALTDYARQRDVLAKKIDIARQISGSILSYGNITSTLNNIKKDVIQTTTQIIDGVSVSISQSVNDIKAADLVGEYQKILDKTKDFAKNLKALKAAGLDSGLFKQIVDAGVESGGATAAAIVSGGADTISELNSLFADLQTTGSDIAATTTDIMYNNGGEIVNGFIQGLQSQDANLQQLATDMANSFADIFTTTINNAIQATIDNAKSAADNAATAVQNFSTSTSNIVADVTNRPSPTASPQRYAAWLSAIGGIDPVRSPQSYASQMASSSTTTPVILQVDGKTLATSLLTYERTNGSIYVRAV